MLVSLPHQLFASVTAVGIDPEKLIEKFGKWGWIGVLAIVFAETGLLIGFFLPGDSLLFVAGLLMALGTLKAPIIPMILGIIVAAIAGDQVGYRIGHKAGPAIFSRPKSKLFNPDHVKRAQKYFDQHGPRTIILARFVPIVRTFAPVVAGVGRMSAKVFTTYNVVGGVIWGGGVTTAGYLLGKRFPWLKERIEILSLVIVAVSLLPIAIDVLRHRRDKAQAK